MYGKKNTFFPDQPSSSSSSSRYPYHTTNSKKLAFISQIVYPKTLLACDDLCYLIGWNNEQFECTIAGFVPVSIISKNLLQGYHELNKAIASSFDNVQFLGNKFQTDAKQPMILGIACPEDRNIDHSVLQEFHSNGIWLNLKIGTDTGDSGDTRKKLLKLKSIYSLGYPYDPVCYLVEYCPYDCNRFYCYLNSANGKEDSLLPTHSLTQVKIDLFQFQEATLKSFLFQSQKQSGTSNTSTSHKFIPNGQKILTPTSQLSKKNRKFENIQLIISQMNISSDLISWIYYYLNKQPHQVNNLLLIEKDQFRQFFLLKQFWIDLLKKSNWILSYFVYLYFLFLKVVYYVITIELPFLETILHFTSWNEIAAAKVTMRNSTSEKKSKSNSSSRINSPSKTKRLSSTSTERSLPGSSSSLQSDSLQPPVAQSPARLTPAAPSFPSLNNIRSEQQIHSNPQSSSVDWWSSPLQWNFYFPLSRSQFPRQKPRISKNMKKDYSFYHYSFFSHEIYQNIQLFQQLFLSHHQLFVNWNIIPNISCVKNFYQKFSFLQIYHGLIYLCLNSILGYLVCTYGYYILLSYIPEELLSSMTNNNNTTTTGAGTEMTRNHDQSIYLSYEIIAKFIITTLQLYKENIIDSTLDWISHTPIGIKLNPFIIEKFNYLIQRCFHYYYLFLGNYYYSICFHFMWNFLHFFPWVGLTYQITLLLDMLMILTFPITLLHNLLSFVLKHHRDILYSLWLFFHGKKYNIFRNRIDTYSYSSSSSLLNPTSSMVMTSSQLLFGILLFSIMFFLLPNIIIYYLFFLMLRLQVIIVYLFFWNMIAVIKKFPFIYCFYYFMDFAFFTNRFYLQVFFPKTIHPSNGSSTPAAPLSQGNYTNKRKNSRERNQLPSNNNNNMNMMNMMMPMTMNDQDEQKKRNNKKSSMSLMNRIIRQNKLESPADPDEINSSEEESPDLSENNIKKSSSSLMPLIIPPNDLPSDQLSTDGERALNTTSMISEAGIATASTGRQEEPQQIEKDYLLPDRSHLMRLQQSPHSPTNANHLSSSPSFGIKSPGRQLRHRKNFMMSLTEQYRKEDDDERLKERQSFLARKRQEKLQIMEDHEEEESQQTEDDWNHSNPVTTTHHSLIIEQQQSNYYSSSALDTPTDVQNRKFFPPLPPAPAPPVLLPSSDDNAAVAVTAAALIQQRQQQQQQPQLSLSEYSDFESNSQLHNNDYSSLIEDKNNKRNTLRTNEELDNLLYDNHRNLLHSSSSRDNYHGDPLPLSTESVVTDYQSHSFASHSQDRQQQQQQELLDTSLPLVTPMPSTVRMQLLPQSYSLFRLIKASLLIFFQADAFDSGDCNSCESQKLSTRSRIFLLLQAIYLSQPLNLIFWKNRFIFTLFDQATVSTILKNNNNHNNSSISSSSPPTSSDSSLFLMNGSSESSNNDGSINYLEASYWEILQPSSPSISVSLENEQSKEKKSQKMMDNPYVSFYRERILFHLLLVYSAYVLLVVMGMIYLVKFHYSSRSPIAQFVFSFLLSSDIPSSSSSLEESTSVIK